LIRPELTLLGGALLLVVADLLFRRLKVLAGIALVILVVGIFQAAGLFGVSTSLLSGMLAADPFAAFFKVLTLLAAAIVVLISMDYRDLPRRFEGEYYALLLFACLGICLLSGATNLVSIYVALELTSLSCYALAGFLKTNPRSSEAALKYLLLGALASGAMLYGMSFLYGLTGTLDTAEIAVKLTGGGIASPLLLLSLFFILCGFGFKVALVPFHMWCPDTYEGAPTPVTAFLSIAPKAGGFAVLLRTFLVALGGVRADWSVAAAALAVLTMTLGNVVALTQTNIKRLLAYSSIAHAGYIMIGFVVASQTGVAGLLFYLLAYLFLNAGAFAVVVLVSNALGSDAISDYAGLSRRAPFAAFSMVIFLLGLVGIPPTAGFFGKYYIFGAAIQAGWVWLALAGVVNSVISLFYYANIIRVMYVLQPASPAPLPRPPLLSAAIFASAALVLVIGLYPQPFVELARVASQLLSSI
jgi:NADH-quinone oxidoreductase subunit N